MDRRRFLLTSLAGALAAPPVAAAQPAFPRRIGVLFVLLSATGKEAQAFRQGLRDAGYIEGRDVVIEWRSAEGDYARLPQLAADLVGRRVDVIVADTTQATQGGAARHGNRPYHHGDRCRSSRIRRRNEPFAARRKHHRPFDHAG